MGDISRVEGNCLNSISESVSGVCTESCSRGVGFSPIFSITYVITCSRIVSAPNLDSSMLGLRSGVMCTNDITVSLGYSMLKENQAMH